MKKELYACVGIDLARRENHQAVLVIGNAVVTERRRKTLSFSHTVDGLRSLEEYLHRMTGERTLERIGINMEPTTGVWRTVASYFHQRGARVFYTRTDVVSAVRKSWSKYAKTDRIDATTLAKLPWTMPERLIPYVPIERRVQRVRELSALQHRLTDDLTRWKNRTLALVETVWQPLLLRLAEKQHFSSLLRAFFARFAMPSDLVKYGRRRFDAWFDRHAHGNTGDDLREEIWNGAEEAAAWEHEVGDQMLDRESFAVLCRHNWRMIELLEKELAPVQARLDEVTRSMLECTVIKELPGVATIIGPGITSILMPVCRFSNTKKAGAYTGFVSRKKASGGREVLGLRITKTGNYRLKRNLALAADKAMFRDPELAAFATRLLQRGKHYNLVRVAVGRKIAVRAFSLLKRIERGERNVHFQYRDLEGCVITKQEAELMAQEIWADHRQRVGKAKSAAPRPVRGSSKAPHPEKQRTSVHH